MNAVVGRCVSLSKAVASLRPRPAVPLLLSLVAPGAWAVNAPDTLDQAAPAMSLAQVDLTSMDERPRMQMHVSGTLLPRFDNIGGSTHTSRIGMSWLPPQRSALGPAVGMTSMYGSALASAGPFANSPSSVDLGLHWRYAPDGNYRVDVTAWRRMASPDALTLVQSQEPTYGARIEMQIGQSAKSGFVADRGFLGFQLESGARITVRRNSGKPMVYYRTKF
jgi:hypothetical protein